MTNIVDSFIYVSRKSNEKTSTFSNSFTFGSHWTHKSLSCDKIERLSWGLSEQNTLVVIFSFHQHKTIQTLKLFIEGVW